MTNKIINIIPIAISIISLIFSLFSAFMSWRNERFKLDFEMVKWSGFAEGGHPIFLWLNVTNYSKLPCAILEIKILNERNGHIIEGVGTGSKKLVSAKKVNDEVKDSLYSLGYPLNLKPYATVGGFFHIISKHGFHQFEEDTVSISIRTTRGTISKKIFMDSGKNIFRVHKHNDPNNKMKIDKHSDGSPINYLEDYKLI